MNPILLAAGVAVLSLPLQWLVCLINRSRLSLWIALLAAAFVFVGTWLVLTAVSS